MAALVDAYTQLKDSYVDFANFSVNEQKANRGDIPMPERFFRFKSNHQKLPILTRFPDLQVSPTATSYEIHSSFILLESIDQSYRLLGGINLPKLIRCRASDGKIYQQLVKGANDDLRQDAVMQQVTNCLFLIVFFCLFLPFPPLRFSKWSMLCLFQVKIRYRRVLSNKKSLSI